MVRKVFSECGFYDQSNMTWQKKEREEGKEGKIAVRKINVSITLVISLLELNIPVSLPLINTNWEETIDVEIKILRIVHYSLKEGN